MDRELVVKLEDDLSKKFSCDWEFFIGNWGWKEIIDYTSWWRKNLCALHAAKAPLAARGKCDKIKMSGCEIIFQ